MSEKLLTKQDVAGIFQVGIRTIDRWRLAGKIKAVYLTPKTIRFELSEVAKLREGRQ